MKLQSIPNHAPRRFAVQATTLPNLALVLFLSGGFTALASAQDPFTEPGAAAAPVPDFGPAPEPTPAAAARRRPKRDEVVETDPVVLAVRGSRPATHAARARAAQIMIRISRPDEALTYLREILEAEPTPVELDQLHRQFGAELFLRMLRDPAFHPDGRRLANLVLNASHQISRDPQRIATQISRLSSDRPDERRLAALELQRGGSASVSELIRALADSRRSDHSSIQSGLRSLGAAASAPLVGALAAPDEGVRLRVIQTLSQLEQRQAVPHLLAHYFAGDSRDEIRGAAQGALERSLQRMPTRQEAEQHLYRRAQAYFSGEPLAEPDSDNMVAIWQWDPTRQTTAEYRYPSQRASLIEAARLAADLARIAPESADYRRLHLMTMLQREKLAGGVDVPLSADVVQYVERFGASVVEDVMFQAARGGHVAAALAAIEVFGGIADRSMIVGSSGRASPIVQICQHPDPRLRLAAAHTVMRFEPGPSFVGASHVADALGYSAGSVGQPRVLVAHPRLDLAQAIAGQLADLGYASDIVVTGRELLLQVVKHADYDFVLASDAIQAPPIREAIQQIRRDPRSGRLPIGVMARGEQYERSLTLRDVDPLTTVFPFRGHIYVPPDYEVTLVAETGMMGPREMLTTLRRAPGLASLPIRIVAQGPALLEARGLARTDPLLEIQELVRFTSRTTMYELTILGQGGTRPPIDQAIDLIRRERVLGNVPLRVVAEGPQLARARDYGGRAVETVGRRTDIERMGSMVQQILGRARHENMPAAERLRQASASLDWLQRVVEEPDRYGIQDVTRQQASLERALRSPQLSAQAARILGTHGSTQAQRALLEIASQNELPLAQRQAAAQALQEAIQRRGIQVTRREVLQQYDRYNQSASLDPGTQQVLGAVLDTIESRGKRAADDHSPLPPPRRKAR